MAKFDFLADLVRFAEIGEGVYLIRRKVAQISARAWFVRILDFVWWLLGAEIL